MWILFCGTMLACSYSPILQIFQHPASYLPNYCRFLHLLFSKKRSSVFVYAMLFMFTSGEFTKNLLSQPGLTTGWQFVPAGIQAKKVFQCMHRHIASILQRTSIHQSAANNTFFLITFHFNKRCFNTLKEMVSSISMLFMIGAK